MSTDDNVVKIPDRLERRAQKIEAALRRRDDAKTDWKEATLELAIELAGARSELPSDQVFGKWYDERFANASKPGEHERAILIRWGNAPEEARAILERTDSQSIQMIDRRFRRSEPAIIGERPTVAKDEAKEIARAYKAEHGHYPSRDRIIQAHRVASATADQALAEVRIEDRIAPQEITYTKAQEHHLEARLKILNQAREAEFEARVVQETKKRIDILFPKLERLEESAKINEKYYRERLEKMAIFTEAEYRDILFCTHEANPSKETRERAFIALNAKKLQLTGKR